MESIGGGGDSALVVGFPDKNSVARVYADGRVERVEIPPVQVKGGSLAYGTDAPAPSPDGKHIALVREDHLGFTTSPGAPPGKSLLRRSWGRARAGLLRSISRHGRGTAAVSCSI